MFIHFMKVLIRIHLLLKNRSRKTWIPASGFCFPIFSTLIKDLQTKDSTTLTSLHQKVDLLKYLQDQGGKFF